MAVGDIKISSLKIGSVDLTQPQGKYAGFNIYEDILNPLGPVADIRVIDPDDSLGKNKINGSGNDDVQISFSLETGNGQASFKLKFFQNANLEDNSTRSDGGTAGKYKQYDIRCCSPELLNAQGHFVSHGYSSLTSDIVKDILKTYLKTDKDIEAEETSGKRRMLFSSEHPLKVLRKLSTEHVSEKYKSSAFVCFQQSTGSGMKYLFTTFEKLFEQSPVVKLTQTPSLNYKSVPENDKQNSIMWINVSSSFFAPVRATAKAQQRSYNPTYGTADQVDQKKVEYKTADGSSSSKGVFGSAPSSADSVPVVTMKDAANDKQKTGVADARKNRLDFLSYLAQNHALLEVPGNPAIKLGSMIELNIPNKSDNGGPGEKQFNGKALVVSIRHKVKPIGQTPRYTMILGVVKGSYKEGGGGNG
jgi:hypothetical protein